MSKYLVFTFLLASQPSYAGGDAFPVTILSIKSTGAEFSLIAQPVSEEREWFDKECSEINVSGSFDKIKWQSYQRPMSLETHLSSIELLRKASQRKTKVYLGYFGNGLSKLTSCSYKSKGLFGGKQTVFSVHDSI